MLKKGTCPHQGFEIPKNSTSGLKFQPFKKTVIAFRSIQNGCNAEKALKIKKNPLLRITKFKKKYKYLTSLAGRSL